MYFVYFAKEVCPVLTNVLMGETSSRNRKQGRLKSLGVKRKD